MDDLVGVPHGRTAHYENGRAAAPHVYLVRLSKAWNIPVSWFLSPKTDDLPPNDLGAVDGAAGTVRIDLKPSLPVGEWDEPSNESIEVEAKFAKAGAFACEVVGDMLAPRVMHRDLIIFWPTDKPKIGVLSLIHNGGARPSIVVPEYNAKTGDVDYVVPSSDGHVLDGTNSVSAFAVGVVRTLSDGDTLTRTNFSGVHLHGI